MQNEESPELPDNPEEYETEQWPSFRADAGNTGYVAADHEFGECVRSEWRSDIRTITDVVIADDTVYAQNGNRVSALAVDDGAVKWHSDDIAASGSPTVAYATVFVGGDELTALDVEDGSVHWQSGLGAASSTSEPGPGPVPAPTVAYGAVYVAVDGTLYAFEASDGSIRWERESVTVSDGPQGETEMAFDRSTVAASSELVYATVDRGIVGLNPVTGETAWTNSQGDQYVSTISASSDLVGARTSDGTLHLYDAETGEFQRNLENFFLPSIGEDVAVTTSEFAISATDLESGDELWSISGRGTQAIGPPTVVGETVYVYFSGRTPQYQNSVVAIDKYDGTVKWTFELNEETTENRLLAFSDGTLYVSGGNVIALREI